MLKEIAAIFVLVTSSGPFLLSSLTAQPVLGIQEKWTAPAWADTLQNPYPFEPLTLPQGEELYSIYCRSCHGKEGRGDGAVGRTLATRPANFHDDLTKSQSDGALFWKITSGNKGMPAYKEQFSEEQRWQLVAYIRELIK